MDERPRPGGSLDGGTRLDGRGRSFLHKRRLFFWFFGVVDYVYYSASDGED